LSDGEDKDLLRNRAFHVRKLGSCRRRHA
jgi:hypothetical protein